GHARRPARAGRQSAPAPRGAPRDFPAAGARVAPGRRNHEPSTRKQSMMLRAARTLLPAVLTFACVAATAADSAADQASNALAREIFKQLIEINTTDSVGNVTTAAEAMAKRFRDAGFPAADVVVVGPENAKKKNLVVRLRGTGQHKPVLLIGHLDVVEARRQGWTSHPFKFPPKPSPLYCRS